MNEKLESETPVATATACSACAIAGKYAEPHGSKERVEEQLRIALDGHPESELWGENGLIAATMRAARMAMNSLPGKLVAFDCLENTLVLCNT